MSRTYRVYIGFDPRQPVAYNIAQFSVVRNASKPVSITPLILSQLPTNKRGLTEFTYSRFLVPYLCNFRGKALFMDPDMVVTGDICELIDKADPRSGGVQVMKKQEKYEWPSLMLFNNAKCKRLTPEFIEKDENDVLNLMWAGGIGDLPKEWNHCVGYQEPKDAKLYHYTQGISCWPETKGVEDKPWIEAFQEANSTVSWDEMMSNSVHADPVNKRLNSAHIA